MSGHPPNRFVSERERREIEQAILGPHHAALIEELRQVRYAIEDLAHSTGAGLCEVADMLRCLIEQREASE